MLSLANRLYPKRAARGQPTTRNGARDQHPTAQPHPFPQRVRYPIVYRVHASAEHDVFCPRCRYNLRGLPKPRCPECGLTFSADQWQSGLLRENVPTWLDRCDPWQPHQVLLRSLYELFRGALRPWRLLTKLDLDGPLVSAGLMLTVGTLWLYFFTTVLVGIATVLHTGASPTASLKSAALHWTPRVLVVALAGCAVIFAFVSAPFIIRVERPTARQQLRLAAYWIPAAGLYVVLPLAILLVYPDFILAAPDTWPALMVPAAFVPPAWACVSGLKRLPRMDVNPWRLPVAIASPFVAGALADWLASCLLPTTLDPPPWVYFF